MIAKRPTLVSLVLVVCFLVGSRPQPLLADDSGLSLTAKAAKDADGKPIIRVHWTCARKDVSSYEVEEKCVDGSGSNFQIVYLAPGGDRGEFIETDVQPGPQYLFRIRADYDDGTASDYH